MRRPYTATLTGSVRFVVIRLNVRTVLVLAAHTRLCLNLVAGRAIHLKHHQMPFYHISLGEITGSNFLLLLNRSTALDACEVTDVLLMHVL